MDPEDIDVERPDEKSIMMYVAEIIKVAEARSETSSAVSDPLLSETAMKLDELEVWTNGAEEALKKKHKLRKYQPQDFKDYAAFERDLAARKATDLYKLNDN